MDKKEIAEKSELRKACETIIKAVETIENNQRSGKKKQQDVGEKTLPMITSEFTLQIMQKNGRPMQVKDIKEGYREESFEINDHRIADHLKKLIKKGKVRLVNPDYKRGRLYQVIH